MDKISRKYAQYHNYNEMTGTHNKRRWDPSTWLKLIPPLCWTKRTYGCSIHVNCSKQTKQKLSNSFVSSN